MTEEVELLFFDTFAHEASEELNLDLVQFPKPVYITEVRIIPLGARVQADFPGGVRLGATNPSQFSIELFVNDLGKPGASTFESLGGLEYNQNGCIHSDCSRRIPTDGLVLRGWYTTITLAVYGLLTVNSVEQRVICAAGRNPQDILPTAPSSQQPITQPIQATVTIAPIEQLQQQQQQPRLKSEWKQQEIQDTYSNSNTVIIDPTYDQFSATSAANPPAPVPATPAPQPLPGQTFDAPYYAPNSAAPVPVDGAAAAVAPLKDPRSYSASHHTPETDWEGSTGGGGTRKGSARSSLDRESGSGRREDRERERERDGRREERERGRDYQKSADHEHCSSDRGGRDSDRDRRDRRYSRSHSRDRERERERPVRDRDYKDRDDHFRDRDRDSRETREVRDRERDSRDSREVRDRDRERYSSSSKSTADYNKRAYRGSSRDDSVREESRSKRPRTPPPVIAVNTTNSSPKRPHTPHIIEHKRIEEAREEFIEKPKSPLPIQSVTKEEAPLVEEEPPQAPALDIEEFEPILSDEDILDDAEPYTEEEYDFTTYTNNDDLIKLFTPGITPISTQEKTRAFKLNNGTYEIDDTLKTIIAFADEFFKETITKYYMADFNKCNAELKEEFVHLNEKVVHVLEDIDNFHCIVRIFVGLNDQSNRNTNQEISAQVCNIVETLIEWLKIALDYDMANAQTQPGYKIRHMKCGVRLAEWCSNDSDFVGLLCERNCFLDKLLMKLYNEDYMAFSIKLLILKTLDTYLLNENAIKLFITNGYKSLIELLLNNPSCRLKFALNSILKKLNLFEVLFKIRNIISKRNVEVDFAAEELTFIIKSLLEILNILQSDMFAFSQPKRFIPMASQFEINRAETKPIIIKFFKMQNFLQCIMVLLTHPNTMNISTIKSPIFEIIAEFMDTKEGLAYLSENVAISNVLVKYLMQITDEEMQFTLIESTENKSHFLGLRLAYNLQSFYHFESLKDLAGINYDYDNLLINEHLHGLFCLTFSTAGKFSCAKMLGLSDNMSLFLNLVNDNPVRYRKAPEIGYIVDLIINFILHCQNIRIFEKHSKQLLTMLNNKDLLEASVAMKLADISGFLRPLETPDLFNYEKIDGLVEIIQKNLDNVTNFPGQIITALRILEHLGISPRNNKTAENNLNAYTELKYKHVILQLFSLEGVQLLTKILHKIIAYFEQPALHSTTFISNQGILIIATITPTIKLLKQMLTYVIESLNTNYKDLTAVPILLQTFTLLQSFPSNSTSYLLAQKSCQDIIETLLGYTQPYSTEIHEKDSLNKTLWSLMCGEVVKYVTKAPFTFTSGLMILSELLPLPLPIQTLEDLNDEEITYAVNLRKLWSAHLHSNSAGIQDMIGKLCTTTNQALLNLLRRVCVQLSDLAANSAIMIARGVLDIVHGALVKLKDDQVCNGHSAKVLNFLACLSTHNTVKSAMLQLFVTSSIKGDDKYPQIINTFVQVLKLNHQQSSHLLAQECICSIIQSICDTEITLLQTCVTSELYLANALPDKEQLTLFVQVMIDHLISEPYSVTYTPILRTLILLTEHDFGFYHLRDYLIKRPNALLNPLTSLSKANLKSSAESVNSASILIDLLRLCCTVEEIDIGQLLFQPRSVTLTAAEMRGIIGWDVEELKEGEAEVEGKSQHPLVVLKDHLKELVVDDSTFENIVESAESLLKIINTKPQENKEVANYVEVILPQAESLLNQFSGRIVYTTSDSVDDRLTSAYWLSSPAEEGEVQLDMVTCDLIEIYRQHFPQGINLVKIVENLCRISTDNNESIEKDKIINAQKDRPRRPFVSAARGRGASTSPHPSLLSANHPHHHHHHLFPSLRGPSAHATSASTSSLHHHLHHNNSNNNSNNNPSNNSNLSAGGGSTAGGGGNNNNNNNSGNSLRPDPFRSRPPNTSRPPSLHVDDFVALETRGAQPTGPTGYNQGSRDMLMQQRQQQQQQQMLGGGGRLGGGGSRGRGGPQGQHYRQM